MIGFFCVCLNDYGHVFLNALPDRSLKANGTRKGINIERSTGRRCTYKSSIDRVQESDKYFVYSIQLQRPTGVLSWRRRDSGVHEGVKIGTVLGYTKG